MSDKQPLVTDRPPAYSHAPPQYQPAPPPNTTVYVTQPAATTTHVVYQRRYGSGDQYLLFSIIVSIVCFFWCGGWPSLICTIPAIFFAISAQEADARGDHETMRTNARMALILDLCGIVFGIVAFIALVIVIIVVNANNSYYYHHYPN